jgi:hypothetical protein
MRIILHPADKSDNRSLARFYSRAISEGVELLIVTAYLTDWAVTSEIKDGCEELSFIVGTDFGITRKHACRSVLKWLPERMKNDFLAADRIPGFHPKLVAWKTKNNHCFLVLGSSNLTQAAFSKNYEANVFTEVSAEEYESIKEWVYEIRRRCSPISEDWLKRYKEAQKPTSRRAAQKREVIHLNLPKGDDVERAIRRRRRQQELFKAIKGRMTNLIRWCARGQIANREFYSKMMRLLGRDGPRFQGRGFEISGKHCDWRDVCTSLLRILSLSPKASSVALDNAVRKEIDRLATVGNPSRGAWFSEMLCHFFAQRYPVLDKPVRIWLRDNKYRGPAKATEGARYIDLAVKLRLALRDNVTNRARNLAELDHAIWQWWHEGR